MVRVRKVGPRERTEGSKQESLHGKVLLSRFYPRGKSGYDESQGWEAFRSTGNANIRGLYRLKWDELRSSILGGNKRQVCWSTLETDIGSGGQYRARLVDLG